ncbi:MAG: glycosyltransferase family 4 protein [Deltaproteobacteria bacterium]|nr:glycosyltransferase family 4 protein [Deltaproteobacteria bacterium]
MPPSALLVCAALGVPALGPSGASAHLRGVAWALRHRGFPLRVVAAKESDPRGVWGAMPVAVETAPIPGWPSWLGGLRERREAWLTARLAEVANRGPAPSFTWERWSLFSDVGARVRAKTGAPWVLEVNAPLAMERARFETVYDPAYAEAWERRVLPQADRVLVVSSWLARWVVHERGVSPHRVRIVPNGVEAYPGDRAATRASLGLTDEPVVGFLGSMKPWHGAERAYALAESLGAVALMVGANPPPPPPGVRVILTGQVDEARSADLVAAMDLGLAPYGPESPPWFCPLKLLAYRAQGTPALASDIGDARRLVGEGGEVLPPGDKSAWISAARRWLGRRVTPNVRTWGDVVDEGLVGLVG